MSALDLAERVLAYVEGDGQATVTRERSLFSRFARSAPTQATEVDAHSVHVLCVVEGRTGASTAASLDDDALRSAARRARDAAEAAARGAAGDYPGLPSPAAASSHDGFDPETASLDPAAAGDALAGAFATAAEAGFEAFGLWTAGATETAIASTTGVHAVDRATDAYLKVICRDEHGRAGWGSAAGRSRSEIDGAAVARAAVARVARVEPVAVPAGDYPVVLDHDAVGSLLEMLGFIAFNGLAHAEGRGALVDRLGERVAAPSINLTDEPDSPRTLPRAFDFEGVPKAPLALLRDGVAQAVVHDSRSAALAGTSSTGHALAPGGSPWGAQPTNLVLAPGSADGVEGLAAPVERGLLVTRLWYLNPVHERTALITGVTREGTFWIEDGRIAAPARDVRFTDSALRILEATEDLSSAQKLVSEAEFYGTRFAYGSVVPALRASGFAVSGGA